MKPFTLDFQSTLQPLTIAIVGFGRFGKLMTHILLKHSTAKIFIIPHHPLTEINTEFHSSRIEFGDLELIQQAKLVIPCVPISHFQDVVQSIAPFLQPGSILMDICSVKTFPVTVMKKYVPKNVEVIASHPMFGPDSFQLNHGLAGLRLVLHNVSAKKAHFDSIKNFFENLAITVIELTPTKHDQLLAWSLGYSYVIGKIGQRLQISPSVIDTLDFQLLLQHTTIISSDSETLFWDMQTYNPFSEKVIQSVEKTVRTLAKKNKYEKEMLQFKS